MARSSALQSVIQYELKPRLLEVRRVQQLTPKMIRVTLGGSDLDGFQEAAPADHVKVFFPVDGAELPVMPTLGPDGLVPPPPGAPRPLFRDYTVRAHRPEAGEIDIDFVTHDHGPAGRWALGAAPGQVLGVLGPRGSVLMPLARDWYLIGGDETALPAIGRWLEQLPPGARAIVRIEVADAAEEQYFGSNAEVDLVWLHRDGTDLLERSIRELELPDGDGFVWLAGEATMLKPIRRYLRQELGLSSDLVDVDGYWKRGVANLDHHIEDDD